MCTGDERLYGRKDSRSYLHNQTVAKKISDCSLLLNRCDRSVFDRFVALSEAHRLSSGCLTLLWRPRSYHSAVDTFQIMALKA